MPAISVWSKRRRMDQIQLSNEEGREKVLPEREHQQWIALRQSTPRYRSKPHYLAWQPQFTARERLVVLAWLMEVCEVLCLHRETYHLSVNLFDRFLSVVAQMPISRLQLLGITAVFVAAKIEEIWPIKADSLVELTADSCTITQLYSMERVMLSKLEWRVLSVTCLQWMQLFCNIGGGLSLLPWDVIPSGPLPKAHIANTTEGDEALKHTDQNEDKALERSVNEGGESLSGEEAEGGDDEGEEIPLRLQWCEFGFPRNIFMRCIKVIDAAMLHYRSLAFDPEALAAATLHALLGPTDAEAAEKVTGHSCSSLREEIEWMRKFIRFPRWDSFLVPLEMTKPNYHVLQEHIAGVPEWVATMLEEDEGVEGDEANANP